MKRLLSSLLLLLVMPVACKPVGAVLLDDGDAFTKDLAVDIRIEGAGVDSTLRTMAFSNDGVTFSAEEPFGPLERDWKLDEADGLKTVYVKVKDEAGDEEVWEDQIILDRTAPALSLKLNGGAASTGKRAVEVELTVEDELSGLESLALSNDGTTFTAIDVDARTASWTLSDGQGEKTVFARAIDGAGNAVKSSAKIRFGTGAPAFALSVNGGDGLVRSRTVTVAATGLTAAQVGELCFSNDATSFPASLCGTALTRSLELTAGDGDKTVHARLTTPDGATKTASKTVTLDATAPTATLSINGGAASTTAQAVSLQFHTQDALSGVAQVQAKNEGGVYQTLSTSPADFTLSAGAGSKRVFLKVTDAAGNSVERFDDITLESSGGAALAAKGMCASKLGGFSPEEIDAEFATMKKAGVQIYRFPLDWSVIGREEGKNLWGGTDNVFKAAAKHGIELMALVTYTPAWARPGKDSSFYPPSDLGPSGSANWNAFIAAAARRYAPNGTERDPSWVGTPAEGFGVTRWEIWNEMNCNFGRDSNLGGFWKPYPEPVRYAGLLKGTYVTLKGHPGTGVGAIDNGRYKNHTVILGGMSGANPNYPETQMPPPAFLDAVYAPGKGNAKGYFDAVGLHPYWWSVGNVETSMVQESQDVYEVMKRYGDGHKKIWATEQGTPTSSVQIWGGAPVRTDEEQAERVGIHWNRWRQLPFAGPMFEFNLREMDTNPWSTHGAFGLLKLNRLSLDEGQFERNVGGWTADANQAAGFPAQSNARVHEGKFTMALKANAAGAMSAKSKGGTQGPAVKPGLKYRAEAHVLAGSTGRPARIGVRFFNGLGAALSTVMGEAVTSGTATWKEISVVATAPANAAHAQVVVDFGSSGAGETQFVDAVIFRPHLFESGPLDWKRGTGTKSGFEIYRDLPAGRVP